MAKEKTTFPAQVVKIINSTKVVINKGADDGIREGQVFLIYRVTEELIDPITKMSLGYLELVKGRGYVSHLQEKIATIEAEIVTENIKETVRRKIPPNEYAVKRILGFDEFTEEETIRPNRVQKPFDNPIVGDLAKPI